MTALPPAVGWMTRVAGFWPAGGVGLICVQVPSRAQMALRLSDLGCFFAGSSARATDAHSVNAQTNAVIRLIMTRLLLFWRHLRGIPDVKNNRSSRFLPFVVPARDYATVDALMHLQQGTTPWE